MRLSIEYGILSSLLNFRFAQDDELELFLNYKLNYKLFKANKTTQLVAKAIHNHLESDSPYDDVLIENYILKRTQMDLNVWLEIMSRLPMPFTLMTHYIKVLKEMEDDERLRRLRNGT